MYAKIQKDYTQHYVIIEGKEIELCPSFIQLDSDTYYGKLVRCLQKYDEELNVKFKISEYLWEIFGEYDWKTKPVTFVQTDRPQREDCAGSCWSGGNIKGIVVDGKRYITCGNIYILNDKGQTIQKI